MSNMNKKEKEDLEKRYPQFDFVRLGFGLLTVGILLFLAAVIIN